MTRASDRRKNRWSDERSSGVAPVMAERGSIKSVGALVVPHSFASIAGVLVLRAALRTRALDVAVGQEHALDRVVELLDALLADQRRLVVAQLAVDRLREVDVLGRMRRVRRVEADRVALPVRDVRLRHARNQLLRRDALVFGLQHDRRAVRVVGADEVHLVPLHPLEAHPDVGLDVLHDVADVERPVRVRQRRRHEQLAGHGYGRRRHRGKPCDVQGNVRF